MTIVEIAGQVLTRRTACCVDSSRSCDVGGRPQLDVGLIQRSRGVGGKRVVRAGCNPMPVRLGVRVRRADTITRSSGFR